ncbi:MAG: FAD-dependent oxidoreductase, partial [Limnochordales bacterium]
MSKRVVVVGAGIVGLWTAYELRRRGMDVVVIDKAELGSGSSFGNAGWVIPARALPLPAPGLHWEGLK